MFSVDPYAAAHDAAVIAERSERATIVLTGEDRRTFLHGLLTNDIAALAAGHGTYAAYLTPQGRMICDMRVIETGPRVLLGVERSVAAPLATRLKTLIFSEDVQVQDASEAFVELGLYGPGAGALIARVAGISTGALQAEYDNVTSPFTVVRDETFGVAGFDLIVPRGDREVVRQRLVDLGAIPADAATLETLRIEAGRPRFGVDMFTDTIPLEAGIDARAISFTKGCYVGQEVIVRVMHRGHGRVARRLVRLVLPAATPPRPGAPVFAAEQRVGEVTSSAESPRAGAPLAFAYVQRDALETGAELRVDASKAFVYQPAD